MYSRTTNDITVSVEPSFLEDQSEPDKNRFVWSYHVRIENHRDVPVRLRSRYWRITDALGQVQEVEGPGVVGMEPTLNPGDRFEYTSGTPLKTPSGIMTGRYHMESDSGEPFAVEIPAFSLDSPHENASIN